MKKNELLHIDKKGLNQERKQLIAATNQLNSYLQAAERILAPLDADQKKRLKNEHMDFIMSELEKQFKFPNATLEFNLQALG